MEEHIVTQTVFRYRVVQVITLVSNPVVVELLGTKHQHRLVAVLVILDDRQCREGLTQTHTIRQDTTVVLLQLVDNGQASILLEIIEFVPYLAFLETCSFVRQVVFGKVVQELTEDIV